MTFRMLLLAICWGVLLLVMFRSSLATGLTRLRKTATVVARKQGKEHEMLARASNGKRINRASLRQDLRNKFDALEVNEGKKFCYETGTGEHLDVYLQKGAD